jgi:hypothetical protein
MSWYFYVLEFVSGLLLTNGVPHFVEVVSGHRFQPPLSARHRRVLAPEQRPLGICKSGGGFILLWFYVPQGSAAGRILVALGVLLAAVSLSAHFGGVRRRQAGKFSDRKRHSFDPLSPS